MALPASFLIPVKSIFSFKECLWFLDRNYDDCLHTVRDHTVLKALAFEDDLLLIRIGAAKQSLRVEILAGRVTQEAIHQVTAYIKDWLDLDRGLQPFYQLLLQEETLAYMPTAFRGLTLIGIPDVFEALSWSIIGQQINLSFAYRLKRRLTEQWGRSLVYGGQVCHVFPAPEVLAQASIAQLREMQFSQKKAEYLTGLATVFREGALSKSLLQNLSGFAAQQQALTALRGIGIWTANYALMKSLRVAEAIPYGDVGLLQALVQHGLIRDRMDQAGMDKLFRRFQGWESYLVFYLWRSLSQPEQ